MQSILEELWYGNISPAIECHKNTQETKELKSYLANHREVLSATLTEKQRETLEKLDDCLEELSAINEREIFIYAFKLGARITLEALTQHQ